jgi:serine/threonine protein kinase
MKVLHKQRILKSKLLTYAKTERDILSKTEHPFIVHLDYAFQTKTKLFFVQEFCPGGDLSSIIKLKKTLPEAIARSYLAEILLALQDLHQRNIIYRDLKPDNIVIDGRGHARLIDFGLAKAGVTENNSGTNSFCGSVSYLAPEMLIKQGHGKAIDWYLLGVLLYEMLCGKPPYFDENK